VKRATKEVCGTTAEYMLDLGIVMSRRHGMEESRASREDNDGFRRIPKDSEGFMVVLRLWRLSWACSSAVVHRVSNSLAIYWAAGLPSSQKSFQLAVGQGLSICKD